MLSFTRPDLLDMRYLLCQRTRSISGRTRHEFSVGGSIIFCKKRMHAAILCYSHPCRVCWIHVLHQTSRWFVCCQVNWHHQDTSIHRRHWRYSVGLESAFLLEKTLLGTAMHRGTRRLPKDWTTAYVWFAGHCYTEETTKPRDFLYGFTEKEKISRRYRRQWGGWPVLLLIILISHMICSNFQIKQRARLIITKWKEWLNGWL